jgi:putative ABC transport system permease protein
MWRDLKFGLQMLWKNAGPNAVAIFSLAVAVAGGTTLFGYMDAAWLRPPAVRDSAHLIRVFVNDGEDPYGACSYPDYVDLRQRSGSFAQLIGLSLHGTIAEQDNGPSRPALVAFVTPNYFSGFGLEAKLGRLWGIQQLGGSDSSPQTVLSYRFWKNRFNGDSNVVGKTVTLDHQEFSIVGVLPRTFTGTERSASPELWVPLDAAALLASRSGRLHDRGYRDMKVFAYLQPQVSLPQGQAEAAGISRELARLYPQTNQNKSFQLIRDEDYRREGSATPVAFYLAIAISVLLIASVNAATLLLVRAEVRRTDVALRLTLGATRLGIGRQLLLETFWLVAAAALAATLLTEVLAPLVGSMFPVIGPLHADLELRLDSRSFLFILTASMAILLGIGLVPAIDAGRTDLMRVVRSQSYLSRSRTRAREILVGVQVGLAVTALCTAVLLTGNLWDGLERQREFGADNLLFVDLATRTAGLNDEHSQQFLDETVRRLNSAGWVKHASLAMAVPLSPFGGGASARVHPAGKSWDAYPEDLEVLYNVVGDEYFAAMGTRIVRGRTFTREDAASKAKVAVVSQALARKFWPVESPVGETLSVDEKDGAENYTIIGVAEDIRYSTVADYPMPYLYFLYPQKGLKEGTVVVAPRVDAKAAVSLFETQLREQNRNVPIWSILTSREIMHYAFRRERLTAVLSAAFGLLALVLAASGLYASMSYIASRRSRDFGIRIALGADKSLILRLVIRRALTIAVTGIAAGLCAGLILNHLLKAMLVGVQGLHLEFIAAMLLVVLVVAIVASYPPAWRAARVDVIAVLKSE